ncbi:hypothetical protein PGH07_00315 [Sulfurovum sp. zt1-1]|uniref:Uncharacterized protein n=1 Tax=Sulfurovum zhangzhouensis TaxID=3019067 RepID=A0ABT7QUU0_9BACT|nr:hypothetical protein [Sulfurovum zhangzhouensis]MDM5270615.1 hypothetical protein [Sulfurovum zhangzhouensis]
MRKHKPSIKLPFLLWTLTVIFIVFYPMLISIYVFLPLLIGVMGYLLMLGIENEKKSYIFASLVYFINLEINLSLPYFLTIITSLVVYVLFFHSLLHLRKCKLCTPIITVILLDFFYLGSLLTYDFIFQETTIMLDNILLYSLVIDLLVVVIL